MCLGRPRIEFHHLNDSFVEISEEMRYLQEIGVPRCDVVGALLLVLVVVGARWNGIVFVVCAELDDFSQDGRVDVGKWDDLIFRVGLVDAQVLKHGS